MLKAYCYDTQCDRDEGIPFVMFAVREVVQESLGFCPVGLVVGHAVRGPLKVIKDNILNDSEIHLQPKKNVLTHVQILKERLFHACNYACKNLQALQRK